jgi:hypothetical protein
MIQVIKISMRIRRINAKVSPRNLAFLRCPAGNSLDSREIKTILSIPRTSSRTSSVKNEIHIWGSVNILGKMLDMKAECGQIKK